MQINIKNKINLLFKNLKDDIIIMFSRNIDVSSPEGRIMKRKKAIIMTAFIGSIAKIIALLIPFITIKISRLYLGEEIYGLWNSVNSFFSIFAFADLGLGSGLQTNLSKASGKDNNDEECVTLISSTFIMLFSFSLILICLFLSIYFFIDWAHLIGATSVEAIKLAGPVFLVIFIPKIIEIPLGLIQRTQIALQEAYNYYLFGIVGSIFSIASIYLNYYLSSPKIMMILCSSLIPMIASLLNYIYYFHISKRKKLAPTRKKFNIKICKLMLSTGFGFLIIHLLMTFGLTSMDTFIVGKLGDLSLAGDYSICLKVASVINLIVNMFCLPLWGVYGEALERGEVDYVKNNVLKMSMLMLLLTSIATIFGMLLSPFVFKILIGSEFVYSKQTLLGMFILQCAFGFLNAYFMILNSTGQIKNQIMAYLLFTPTSFILKWILTPIYGVGIMPWITLVTYVLIMYPIIILSAHNVIKKYKINKIDIGLRKENI